MEMDRCKEIERTIIKRYRKSIWRKFIRAIQEYDLIQDGDNIAVCISGGKDSVLLAKLLQEVQRHGQMEFKLKFLSVVSENDKERKEKLLQIADLLHIPLDIFSFQTAEEENTEEHSISWFYQCAKELGCKKIALGNHFDDIVETILMELLYNGKIQTKMPKQHSKEFAGMELIRPMYLIKEADIITWRDYNQLELLPDRDEVMDGKGKEENQEENRQEIREWIRQFRATSEVIDRNIFRSVHDINLDTLIGYHTSEWEYCFLDDYRKIFVDKGV